MFTNKNDLAGAILGPAAVVFCLSCFCHMSEKIKRSPRVPQLSTRSETFRHRLGLCKEPTLTGCERVHTRKPSSPWTRCFPSERDRGGCKGLFDHSGGHIQRLPA